MLGIDFTPLKKPEPISITQTVVDVYRVSQGIEERIKVGDQYTISFENEMGYQEQQIMTEEDMRTLQQNIQLWIEMRAERTRGNVLKTPTKVCAVKG